MSTSAPVSFPTRLGGPYRPFRSGEAITSAMSAPASVAECTRLSNAAQAQFLIKNPGGASNVTAFTVHYGRWVATDPKHAPVGSDNEIAGAFVEDGTVAVTGATDDKYIAVPPFNTYGDPVAIYVDTLTGSVSGAGQTFKFWVRDLG